MVPSPDTVGADAALAGLRRFVVCRAVASPFGHDYRSLAKGFASLEQALAACPRIAEESGTQLDQLVVLEIHEFWDYF